MLTNLVYMLVMCTLFKVELFSKFLLTFNFLLLSNQTHVVQYACKSAQTMLCGVVAPRYQGEQSVTTPPIKLRALKLLCYINYSKPKSYIKLIINKLVQFMHRIHKKLNIDAKDWQILPRN